ncbi:MAG: hypothetical protein LUH15_13170 [Tannerellaceae bacterium]|nr:hypothetical protein [Tannerellaceae bacterium]
MKESNILTTFIEEISENIYFSQMKKIKKEYVHKSHEEYVLISDILEIPDEYIPEDVSKSNRNKYLYFTAYPKYDCTFCFDHELDHFPFMMIVEVIRQAGIAIGHTIHGVPLRGNSGIMDKVHLNVLKFMELDIPLLIVIKDMVVKQKKSRHERIMYFYFYQNGTLCASCEINASIMEIDIYERLRMNSRAEILKNTFFEKHPTTNLKMLDEKMKELTLVD